MSSSVAHARQVLQSLKECGLKHVIICPGSRNAPFIYASEEVDLTYHSRIDERVAAFTALGMGEETGKPVAIITTSGSAISHAYPAVLEAEAAGIPLLLISADRPTYLKNSGANQTLDQTRLFGDHVRFFLDVHENYPLKALAQETARCYQAALTGPAHMNICFEEPLVPTEQEQELAPTPSILPKQPLNFPKYHTGHGGEPTEGALVIAGAGSNMLATHYATTYNLPIIADITVPARLNNNSVNNPSKAVEHFKDRINMVVVFGKPTLFRPVLKLLNDDSVRVVVIADDEKWNNTALNTLAFAHLGNGSVIFDGDESWLNEWQEWNKQQHSNKQPPTEQGLTSLTAAEAVWNSTTCARLLVGASNPIRCVSTVATQKLPAEKIFTHRGLAGIDGTIASGIGIATASKEPTRIYCGDITTLHDANALLLAPSEQQPDVHLVIANDGGGTIFTTLEHGAQKAHQSTVERFLTTTQNVDFQALAQAYGWEYYRAETREELEKQLENYSGGKVITEIRLD